MMGLLLLLALFCFFRESVIFGTYITTTSNMHTKMCLKVIRANILFFDSNPIGRILTRFSKDMVALDLVAPAISVMMTYGIFRALTVSISVVIINYWLLIPLAFSFGYLLYLMRNA
jgi:ABC-type multidrug transport system fused ATPase/permease subunit